MSVSDFPPLPPGASNTPSPLPVTLVDTSPSTQPGDADQSSQYLATQYVDISSSERIAQLVRLHIRDFAMPFQARVSCSGSSFRFDLPVRNIDPNVFQMVLVGVPTDVEITPSVTTLTQGTDYTLDYRQGVILMATAPAAGSMLISTGSYYKSFLPGELGLYVRQAYLIHTNDTDTVPQLDVWPAVTAPVSGYGLPAPYQLPEVEEYPLSLLVAHLALFDLAIEGSQQYDIHTPDSVMIPLAERYQQIVAMSSMVEQKYKDMCILLGVGAYRISSTDLRRVSRTTGRYVPVFRAREYDDLTWAQRELLPRDRPTNGRVITYQNRYISTRSYNRDDVVDENSNRYLAMQPVPPGKDPAVDVDPVTGYGYFWVLTNVNSGWMGMW